MKKPPEVLVVFLNEGFQLRRVFAVDDEGFGISAGFQGVRAGSGLAFGSA